MCSLGTTARRNGNNLQPVVVLLVIMLYYAGRTFYGIQEKLFQNLDGTLFKLRSLATQKYQLTMDRNNSQNIWILKRRPSTVLMSGHNFSSLPCVISMLHIWSRMKEVNKKKEGLTLMRDTAHRVFNTARAYHGQCVSNIPWNKLVEHVSSTKKPVVKNCQPDAAL